MPPTGRDLKRANQTLGSCRAAPGRDFGGGKISRDIRNAAHHVRRPCRAHRSKPCHTHCLLNGAWGQQHWLEKEKSGEQSPAKCCQSPGNEGVWDVGVVLVVFVGLGVCTWRCFGTSPTHTLGVGHFGVPSLDPQVFVWLQVCEEKEMKTSSKWLKMKIQTQVNSDTLPTSRILICAAIIHNYH